MKRVLIISGGTLPVPAVKGGAVETLIDLLTEQNEKEPTFLLEVVSGECHRKAHIENEYRYTSFQRIYYPLKVRIMDKVRYWYKENIRHDWRSMFVRNQEKSRYYAKCLTERLSLNEYDAIVVENNMSLLKNLAEKLGDSFSEKCYYHMHSVLIDNKAMIPYLARCKKILVVSDYVKAELKKKVPEFSDTVIEKVTNGIKTKEVSTEEHRAVRAKLREQYGIEETEKVFLYCGRLSPEKGALELVKAFRKSGLSRARLLVAGSAYSGEGETNGYVKQIYEAASGCGNQIIFTGYVPHESLESYYRMADVLVVPSVVGDAAPLTVLEGMAVGIRLIASNVGGIPEYTVEYSKKQLVEHDGDFVMHLQKAMESCCSLEHQINDQEEKLIYSDVQFFREFGRAVAEE